MFKHKKAVTLATLIGLVTPINYLPNHVIKIDDNIELESTCGFCEESIKLLDESLSLFNEKYSFDIDVSFLKAPKLNFPSDVGGMTFFKLGHDDLTKENFIKLFGQDQYDGLEGCDVIVMAPFDSYKKWEKKENSLFDSLYMQNPNPSILYKRAILHEMGHIIYHSLKNQELVDKISDIDIDSESYKGGSPTSHPAHPSFYTFFLTCAPDFSRDLIEKSVNEQFADIFSLYTLGYLTEDIPDKELLKKVDLVCEKLEPYI
jgi:hypothetical protein